MKRRDFITAFSSATGAALLSAHAPGWAQGLAQRAAGATDRILVLVELKGGNDGLNTVVPFADSTYYQLRPVIGIEPDEVIKLDTKTGLHPELKPLTALWEQKELGIIQGVGYPEPNLSHFRSIEIWETASKSTEYLSDGWVARGLKAGLSDRRHFTVDGVRIGSSEQGALAGARAVSLTDPEAFVNRSKFASGGKAAEVKNNPALKHVMQIEDDVNQAAQGLRADKYNFTTAFPQGAFGNSVRAAAQVVASQKNMAAGQGGVPVITLTLGSFDTHQNQLNNHANLLRQFAEGMVALKSAFSELGAWDRTLVMTFSEFGRRARQNNSNGTDHGTVAPHFVAGGAVRGGLYGQPPDLTRLDAAQNALYSTDFRQLYATIASDWWGVQPDAVTRGRFEPLKFLKT
jgi:uncharacterized protein (DUF1501 family)